jgi:PAS domain-containing protein
MSVDVPGQADVRQASQANASAPTVDREDGHSAREAPDAARRSTGDSDARPDQPLELILARNLVSLLALAAILVDVDGRIVFYNEAAAKIIGAPFEEIGVLTPEEWNARFGPLDDRGHPVPPDELPLTVALRKGTPAHGCFRIRDERGTIDIEAGALPLVGPAGNHGALVVFWRSETERGTGG